MQLLLLGEEICRVGLARLGDLRLGRRALETVESLDDSTLGKSGLRGELEKLCIQQSTSHSSRPEIFIPAGFVR